MSRLLAAALAAPLALVLALAACGDTLVEHGASQTLLGVGPCGEGEIACGGGCVKEDATVCGASCQACPAPADPHAAAACVAHACAAECAPGWLRSGDACRRAQAVSAGFAHTCALLDDGAVRCWGANEHGQLGDGTAQDSAVPVTAQLPSPASAIAAGFVHSCAITAADGAVYCWGDNTTGSLGDGTRTQRVAPVRVQGLPGPATLLTAGGGETSSVAPTYYGHTCAAAGGGVFCWGSDDAGQLGDGTSAGAADTGRTKPVQTTGLKGAPTALAAGDRHTCAIVAGQVWCWGAGGSWQLGDGGTTDQAKPVQAQTTPSGAQATAVAGGAAHTCAVVGSALQCWGSSSAGQASGGDSAQATIQRPANVALGALQPVAVAAGNAHTCAVGTAGDVACFGANDQSQLAAPPTPRGSFTVSVAPARAITAGFDHACALLLDGGIACWGANDRGELGLGTAGGPVATPALVSGR